MLNKRKSIRLNAFGRFLATVILAAIAGCTGGDVPEPAGPVTVTDTRLGMGTLVEVRVTASDSAVARQAVKRALDEMDRLYMLFDPGLEHSHIRAINLNAGKGGTSAAPEVLEVLKRAKYFTELTKGVFDITVKPLLDLWLASGDTFAIPSQGILKATKSLVWTAGLEVDDEVTLKHALMGIDPSGIAKGFILDRMAEVLKGSSVGKARIRAGNDIRLVGRTADTWQVSIPHPRIADATIATLVTGRGGISTARDADRYFDRNGIRYHHILDPRTGYPADASISVTVWAENGMDADALATGVFVLGPDEGMRLIESLDKTEAVIYYLNEDKIESVVSSGWAGKLR